MPAPDASALELPCGAAYSFELKNIGAAHAACQRRFEAALSKAVPFIVVDNTHSERSHYRGRYLQRAEACGYQCAVVEIVCAGLVSLFILFTGTYVRTFHCESSSHKP